MLEYLCFSRLKKFFTFTTVLRSEINTNEYVGTVNVIFCFIEIFVGKHFTYKI